MFSFLKRSLLCALLIFWFIILVNLTNPTLTLEFHLSAIPNQDSRWIANIFSWFEPYLWHYFLQIVHIIVDVYCCSLQWTFFISQRIFHFSFTFNTLLSLLVMPVWSDACMIWWMYDPMPIWTDALCEINSALSITARRTQRCLRSIAYSPYLPTNLFRYLQEYFFNTGLIFMLVSSGTETCSLSRVASGGVRPTLCIKICADAQEASVLELWHLEFALPSGKHTQIWLWKFSSTRTPIHAIIRPNVAQYHWPGQATALELLWLPTVGEFFDLMKLE